MSDGETERAAKNEALRLSIVNWIPSEIARQPAKLKEFEDALAADVAKHSISFTRFGDFVSVVCVNLTYAMSSGVLCPWGTHARLVQSICKCR